MQETRATAAHERQKSEMGKKLRDDGARRRRHGSWPLILQRCPSLLPGLHSNGIWYYRRPRLPHYRRTNIYISRYIICFMPNYIIMHIDEDLSTHAMLASPRFSFSHQLPRYAVINSSEPSLLLYQPSLHSYVAPRETRLAPSLYTHNPHRLLPL